MAKGKKCGLMRTPVVLGRYWLFQGTYYMNWIERLHRFILEVLFSVLVWAVLCPIESEGWRLAGAFLVAHTANMVLNGHIFALFKHDLYWGGFYKQWNDFAAYVVGIQQRLYKRPCLGLDQAAVFGSLSHGHFNDCSDLDLRFIAHPGFWNGWRVAHRVFEERLRALSTGFPIDIYMFHSQSELGQKMNLERENPIVIYTAGKPRTNVSDFDKFVPQMRANHG